MVIEKAANGRHRTPAENFTARKLATLDRAMLDERVSPLTFLVLYYLASASDRQTRTAKRKQKTIARALNITTRTVQLALVRLRDLGYLIFEIKERGTYVNAYRIVLAEMTTGGSRFENEKPNLDSPSVSKRRMNPSEKTHQGVEKDESSFAHDLPLNPLNIPSHLGEPALDKLGTLIRRRIGDDRFSSWLGSARIGIKSDEVGIVFLVSKFRCVYVKNNFEQDILECWHSLDPLKKRIEFSYDPIMCQGQ
jgi:hypothetical protein